MPCTIEVPAAELYNKQTGEFIPVKATTLVMEYSLVAVSKWESKWKIPYLSKTKKTEEQTLDLIRFMTLTKHVDPNVYLCFTEQNFRDILAYIEDPQTATKINDRSSGKKEEILTSEVIYAYMVLQGIPKEFEKWPLNRLITLIRVVSIKNTPPKKRGRKETLAHYKALNEARKLKYGTKG